MVDQTRDTTREAVGKLTVAYSPAIEFAPVLRRGPLSLPEVIQQFDGPAAFGQAKEWALANQDKA